jgi:hypothetical protein
VGLLVRVNPGAGWVDRGDSRGYHAWLCQDHEFFLEWRREDAV